MKKIKLLILDVDGVQTDGRIYYSEKGSQLRAFHVLDGLAVRIALFSGLNIAIISSKDSEIIKQRAEDIGIIDVFLGDDNKVKQAQYLCEKYNITFKDIAFMGDDLIDIPLMKLCVFPVAPSNACKEVKQIAKYVAKASGGSGAVREVVEYLFGSYDWSKAVNTFLQERASIQ